MQKKVPISDGSGTRMKKEEIEYTKQLFNLYLEGGYSVRALARKSNIPWTTLRDRFSRFFGKDYARRQGGEGTIHKVLRDYTEDPSFSEADREKIRLWYEKNKSLLLETSYHDNLSRSTRLYSDKKISRDGKFILTLKDEICNPNPN